MSYAVYLSSWADYKAYHSSHQTFEEADKQARRIITLGAFITGPKGFYASYAKPMGTIYSYIHQGWK